MSLPWNLIIPGVVEVTKEIVSLFKGRKGNWRRRRKAAKFIRSKFKGIKDSQVNLVIELVVHAYKKGYNEEQMQQFVRGIIKYLDRWQPSGVKR